MIANPIPWPDGARCAVAMTWDMDADSAFNWYNKETADNLVAAQSWTRYDPLIAIPRLVEQFARRGLHLTFFVPGWVIEKYPAQIDLLLKNGHEIALHGYLHERSNEIANDEEHYWLGRGLNAYRKHLGAGPRGWRAPSFVFSKHSLRYLLEAGLEYDSSLMGDDIPTPCATATPRCSNFPSIGHSTTSRTTPTTAISATGCRSPRRNARWRSSAASSTRPGNSARCGSRSGIRRCRAALPGSRRSSNFSTICARRAASGSRGSTRCVTTCTS